MELQAVLSNAVVIFFRVIYWLFIIRIFMSWLPMGQRSGLMDILYTMTEPILGPIRKMVQNSPIGGGMILDFSPVIALFVLNIVQTVLLMLISLIP